MAPTENSELRPKDIKSNRLRPYAQVSGTNTESIRSCPDRLRSVEVENAKLLPRKDGDDDSGPSPNSVRFSWLAAQSSSINPNPFPFPSSPPHPDSNTARPLPIQDHLQNVLSLQNAATVTDGLQTKAPETMNANGTHPPHRHQQPLSQPRSQRNNVHDITTSINTTAHGPMPSHIQVAKPYVFQQAIEYCLNDLGVAQAREDNIRLAGVQWIDNVRKALKLPVRTFDTAAVYYHKFRLSHADNEYSFMDAAAASLFAACKIEDTLKKSRDILCAAHNLKLSSRADHLSSDDPIFEQQSRSIIGLERLMLEASSFDFRNRHPQLLLVKIAKYHGHERHSAITRTAYDVSIDLYRTFAPLKQNTPTMAFACLELAGKLHGQEKESIADGRDYPRWNVERAMVMETLLDLLELYTHYRDKTSVGPEFSRDTFLEIQILLNEELNTRRIPRYTEYLDANQVSKKVDPTGYAGATTNGVLPSPNGMNMNGRLKTSPTSPATPGTPGIRQKAGERGKEGTVRFMLNPDREREEKAITIQYAPLLASMRR